MNVTMHEVIKKDMIFLQQDIKKRNDGLDIMVQKAKEIGLIEEGKSFLDAVLKREEEVPTAIGYQVAIPHGKSDVVNQPFIGFLQTNDDFIWTDGHDEKVKLIFLIGVPRKNENNIHLKLISQLSKKLLDDEFRDKLLNCVNTNEAYELFASI